MTSKKILLFATPILLAILVGGMATVEAMAIEEIEVGDGIKITGKGEGACTDAEGEPGTASARVRYQMLVQETAEDGFSGVARADLAIKSTCADNIVLKGLGPLDFVFDKNTDFVSITGPHHDGVFFVHNNENSGPVKIEGILNLGGQEGEKFQILVLGKIQTPADPTGRQ